MTDALNYLANESRIPAFANEEDGTVGVTYEQLCLDPKSKYKADNWLEANGYVKAQDRDRKFRVGATKRACRK